MKIILDAMGGDNAPMEILLGAAQAIREYGVEVIAVGNEQKIRDCAETEKIDLAGMRIVPAASVIDMHDNPVAAVRHKEDSSMVIALRMLAQGEGDAVVSAGSTGALLTGATLIVKRIRGVTRAAIAVIMPGQKQPYLLLDCGANTEYTPEMLYSFAVMGSVYMKNVMGRGDPAVALLNNGTEDTKGPPDYVSAHQLLKSSGSIRFIGNIEPNCVPFGDADVVVCDGFSGNIVLKLTEGLGKFFSSELKLIFKANPLTMLSSLAVKGGIRQFKDKLDPEVYGGAPLLGISRIVIKAHGSSRASGIKHAIRQAKSCCENRMIEEIQNNLQVQENG